MTQGDESTLKLVFLDLDGVANRWSNRPDPRMVEPECVEHLNAILDATGAKVVVSSSLRHMVHSGHMTLAGLEYLFRSHGVRCSIVGITAPDADDDGMFDTQAERGHLIRMWLREHKYVGKYVVLDDDDDGISDCALPFVHVNGSKGLTAENAQRAIEILNG